MTIRGSIKWCWLLAVAISGSRMAAAEQAVPDSARRDSTPAVLIGHVTDSSGARLAGAEITLVHSDKVHAITGDSGEFRITGLAPGANVFNVRRLGFQAASFTAMLRPGKTHRATFALSATPQALPTVAVSDTGQGSHWLDAFERRKNSARGTFIERKEIEKKMARTGTDIIRTVPGVRLITNRNGTNQVVLTRGGIGPRPCVPTMYVHGMPYSGMLDDFSADDIEAIELYVGVSEVPPELDRTGRGICGAIVVWTRDPNKARDGR